MNATASLCVPVGKLPAMLNARDDATLGLDPGVRIFGGIDRP